MASWIYRVNIKQFLSDKMPTLTVAENVAKELESVPYWIFQDLPKRLVEETRAATERIPDDKDYHDLAFNRVLAQIYDIADNERVWLGLR